MKAEPMTQKPAFSLMKQGNIQNIYHLQMPHWLFTDPRYMELRWTGRAVRMGWV